MVTSAWDLFDASVSFLLGFFLSLSIARKFGLSKKYCAFIYLWHTAFCVFYCWYVLSYGGDAIGYYRRATSGSLDLGIGTAGVDLLTAVFARALGMSFWGTSLIFNIFGSIGLIAFAGSLKVIAQTRSLRPRWLGVVIIFLPSVSFWSSAIGKDSLAFMSVGLMLWAAQQLTKSVALQVLAVAIMMLVRPHIALLMIASVAIALGLQRGVSPLKRTFIFGLSMIAAIALLPLVLNYAGVGGGGDVDAIMDYVDQRQAQNMEGGASVDISSMSLPAKFFTYAFRPTVLEARSVFALAASVDNLILLYLFLIGGWKLVIGRRAMMPHDRIFLISYAFTAWMILALTTANLGIAIRQKWMFVPMLIVLFLSVLGRQRVGASYYRSRQLINASLEPVSESTGRSQRPS
ncbi:hypothetical protein [Pigmentiphaga soli]|uniref:hypothetical protein n=1 Tax=Pigmentiphaga soli TaxID=1007095 RepID=UPI0031E8C3D3